MREIKMINRKIIPPESLRVGEGAIFPPLSSSEIVNTME